MENIAGFDFLPLLFDEDGKPKDAAATNEFLAAACKVTDVVLIAHGFRNSEAEARSLYTNFLTNFRAHIVPLRLEKTKWLVGGVFWPSKKFDEVPELAAQAAGNTASLEDAGTGPAAEDRAAVEKKLRDLRDTVARPEQQRRIDAAIVLLDRVEGDPAAQNEFVDHVRSLLSNVDIDPTEAIDQFRSVEGSHMLEVLQAAVVIPTQAAAGDEGGATAFNAYDEFGGGGGGVLGFRDFLENIFGSIGRFLNLTTWYVMKERSGSVGANGVTDLVRKIKALPDPKPRVHLVGHSLGGRLVTSCAKSLGEASILDSLNLLEAAFSHYGFSSAPGGQLGFFKTVFEKNVVRGPIIATYSALDSVVGLAYALSSRLAHDNVKAIGDENDEFGGIGRNGSQNFPAAKRIDLHPAGTAYEPFPAGVLTNLNGSAKLILNHGDVTNPAVTYAVATSIACGISKRATQGA